MQTPFPFLVSSRLPDAAPLLPNPKSLQHILPPPRPLLILPMPTFSTLGALLASRLLIVALLLERYKPNLGFRESVLSVLRQQVIRHVLEMGLLAHLGAELAVVAQVRQLVRVLFKVALQSLGAQEFLSQFAGAGFADGDFCYGAEGYFAYNCQ